MPWPANATTRAVAERLVAAHHATRWRYSFVSWALSEGCYCAITLGPRNPPIGDVAMPLVAERMYEIMQAIGMPKTDWPSGFRFQFLPLLSLPFGLLTGKDDQAVRLNDEVHLDEAELARIINFVCSAKDKVSELAGTVEQALDFAREKMPWHPAAIYAVPVGYKVIGRLQDCDAQLEACRAHVQSKDNPTFLQVYDRFAVQLREARW